MMNFKKPVFWIVLAIVAVLVAAAIILLLNPPAGDNAPKDDVPAVTQPDDQLKAEYPSFFDLDTAKGLTVYVAKFSQDVYACTLMPTGQLTEDLSSLADAPFADIQTMRQILESYGLSANAVTVTPYYNPKSSYIAPDLFEEGGMAEVLYQLGLGPAPAEDEAVEDAAFPYRVCWADYSEAGEKALRATYYPVTSQYSYANELRYVAVGIKTAADLQAFTALAQYQFSMDASVGDAASFNTAVAKYDGAFFAEHGLVIVYIPSESFSISYKLADVTAQGSELHIAIAEQRPEGDLTTAMAGWFMIVEIEQEILSQTDHFSAG